MRLVTSFSVRTLARSACPNGGARHRPRQLTLRCHGWVVHKRHGVADPRQQWATTTTGTLADLLASIQALEQRVNALEIQLSYATKLAFDKEPR